MDLEQFSKWSKAVEAVIEGNKHMTRGIPIFILLALGILTVCASAPIQAPSSAQWAEIEAVYDRACLSPGSGHIIKVLNAASGSVVLFSCSYPGSRETSFHITRVDKQGWSLPINLDESLVLYKGTAFIDAVTNVSTKGDAIVVKALVHVDDDAYCCPSMETKISFYLEHFLHGKAPTNVAMWPRDVK